MMFSEFSKYVWLKYVYTALLYVCFMYKFMCNLTFKIIKMSVGVVYIVTVHICCDAFTQQNHI